jgi:hypothetical protein
MKNKNFIVLAKIDHILFKADALANIQKSNPKDFQTHNDCRFGKWYDTEGQQQFGHSKSFHNILAPHTLVHNSVLNSFKLIKGRDAMLYKDELKANFKTMESASDELFALMDKMLDEKAAYDDTKNENKNI